MPLPHRSPDPLALTTIGTVARRAEELGFRDLWVTENTVDEGTCLDPVVALTYAASITNRIGVGAAVIVLPIHHPLTVAHQWATLDFVSGGLAILAVGLGRAHHYRDFQVPVAQRVRRFRAEAELIKALWTENKGPPRGGVRLLQGPGHRGEVRDRGEYFRGEDREAAHGGGAKATPAPCGWGS